MSSVFELKFDAKHGVCESTLLLATLAKGHFYNVVNKTADMDNGSVTAIDITKHTEDDVFEVKQPTIKDKVALILNPVKIYEEYAKQCQEEAFYYIGAGERARAYEIYETDRFALSKEAFKDGSTLAKGKYVVVDPSSLKLTTAAANPNASTVTNAFVGYIYDIAANGNYKVFVIRNQAV